MTADLSPPTSTSGRGQRGALPPITSQPVPLDDQRGVLPGRPRRRGCSGPGPPDPLARRPGAESSRGQGRTPPNAFMVLTWNHVRRTSMAAYSSGVSAPSGGSPAAINEVEERPQLAVSGAFPVKPFAPEAAQHRGAERPHGAFGQARVCRRVRESARSSSDRLASFVVSLGRGTAPRSPPRRPAPLRPSSSARRRPRAASPRPPSARTPRRAYSGALRRLDAWLDVRPLEDATLAAHLGEFHDQGRAPASAATAATGGRQAVEDGGKRGRSGRRTSPPSSPPATSRAAAAASPRRSPSSAAASTP